MRRLICSCLVVAAACTSEPSQSDTSADDSTSTGETPPTTLDLTTIGDDGLTTGADTSATAGSSDTAAVDSGTGNEEGTTGTLDTGGESTTGAPDTSGSDSTGVGEPVIEWCILQYPPSISAAPDEATTVYARLYVEGITDQTEFVDPDPMLVSQFGYGDDGSMPDDAWTWVDGAGNPGWDGTMAMGGFGNENNDEYMGELSFSAVGTYDYAARFSVDGGTTWVYCDLDGLVEGGYTTDQAGDAVVE